MPMLHSSIDEHEKKNRIKKEFSKITTSCTIGTCLVHRAFPCQTNSDVLVRGFFHRSASVPVRLASESGKGRWTRDQEFALFEDMLHDTYQFHDLSVLIHQTFHTQKLFYVP